MAYRPPECRPQRLLRDARTDGLTSLAVLLGAGGAALGWTWADPAVGLVITVMIVAVVRQAAGEIWRRLMDAVDPALVDQAEHALRGTPGVLDTGQVRLRWTGHQIRAECEIVVAPDITAAQAHQITVNAEHTRFIGTEELLLSPDSR